MRRPATPAALVLLLVACTSPGAGTAGSGAGSGPSRGPGGASAPAASAPAPGGPSAEDAAAAEFEELERRFDARLGLFAVDTGSGRALAHRADERFGFASTLKALAAGALLQRTSDAELDEVVTWSAGELVPHSPVTERHAGSGLPLREVARAAVTVSDNTAANVVLERLGGPARLEADLRALGDATTEVVDAEPELNDVAPGEVENTTSPRAVAASLRAYALDGALAAGDREQLVKWLRGNTTGDELVRAGVPAGWVVGDKTGRAGVHGSLNDVAVLWPPGGRAPWVLAVLSDRADVDAEPDPALVAAATRVVVGRLR
ncbi:class A beta-lactamase [Kineococcus gypseus]|uniref:class A beta-lactamase n=1 Tax=Kineococcus gypseus TaxID=1637102 RepID=UPI003D7DA330